MPAPQRNSLIDVVDSDDQPIGTVTRGEALSEGVGFRVAHALLLNSAGEIVLQQLSPSRERSPLKWGSSVAGYLHAGETYDEAIQRRSSEELGLAIPLQRAARTRMDEEGGATKFIHIYLGETETAQIRNRQHIADIRFWSEDEIERALADHPERFTATFPLVWRAFRSRSAH